MNPLRAAAIEALKPRERCNGKTCSCNEYPKRMKAFHDLATPERVLELMGPEQGEV
jgi:hypothetical protein